MGIGMSALVAGLIMAPLTSSADGTTDVGSDELVGAGTSRCLSVAGASAADVAVVNITNVAATGNGWGALRASDATPVFDRPVSDQYASVNFAANTPPNPNLAFTKIGPDNRFCYDGAVSSHDVILDLAAIIPAANINAIDPTRITDTRSETPPPPSTPPPTSPPSNPGDSRNCSDFATYAEAKEWFDTYYPYYGDVANLDQNGDLIPCESLPGAP